MHTIACRDTSVTDVWLPVAESRCCCNHSRSSAGAPDLGFSRRRRLISQQEACQPLERAEIDRFEAEATRLTQKWDREATQEAAPASGIGPAPGTLHPGANKVS